MTEQNAMIKLELAQAAAWEAIRETQESMRELRESVRETQESVRELRESTRETQESVRKLSENMEAANKRSGKFDRKFGELWELMVVPNIKEKFNELGFHFDSVGRNMEYDKPDGSGKSLAEVDILLENGEFAIVVEVKDSFKKKYLTEHLNRMKKLKTLPRFAKKKLYGAIAAGFARGDSKQQAFESGFYVVSRPDSMNVQIEQFPKGYKPKAW